jgi:hypothetical protein
LGGLRQAKAKNIPWLKVDTMWIHNVPMIRCLFQSHRVSVQKKHIITKDVIGLQVGVGNIMIAQVPKSEYMLIIT